MPPEQKNWVFLATMLIIALFSVVLVFSNVKYQGRSLARGAVASNVEEIMGEIKVEDERLKASLRNPGQKRHEVYSEASRIVGLLEELIKETPENPTPQRVGDWDRLTSRSVAAANRLADIAGDTATEWAKAEPAYRALQKTCIDCHDQFGKK